MLTYFNSFNLFMISVGLAEGSCFPWFGKNFPGSIWNKKCFKENLDLLLILTICGVMYVYLHICLSFEINWCLLGHHGWKMLNRPLYYHENLTLYNIQYNFLLEMDEIVKKQLFYCSPAPSSRFELSFLLTTPRERATLPSMTSIKHAAVKLFPLHLLLYLLSPHSALLFVCSALLWHR